MAFQSITVTAGMTTRQIMEAFDKRVPLKGTVNPNGNQAAAEAGVSYFNTNNGSFWMCTAPGSSSTATWTSFITSFSDATDAAVGLVELATNGEVAALTDTTRAITPAGLGSIISITVANNTLVKRTAAGRIKSAAASADEDVVILSQLNTAVAGLSASIGALNTSTDTRLDVLESAQDAAYKPIVGGRLTLQSGVPMSLTDQLAKTTLYYTPDRQTEIALWDTVASLWRLYALSEVSLSLSGLTSGLPYDIFIYYSSGLVLEAVAWSSVVTRATSLATQNGVFVKSGSPGRRYLGTILPSASGQCEDSEKHRGIYNHFNQRPRAVSFIDTSVYGMASITTTPSPIGANTTLGVNKATVVSGVDALKATLDLIEYVQWRSGALTKVGIGINSTSVDSAQRSIMADLSGKIPYQALYSGYLPGGRVNEIVGLNYTVSISGVCDIGGLGNGGSSGGLRGDVLL